MIGGRGRGPGDSAGGGSGFRGGAASGTPGKATLSQGLPRRDGAIASDDAPVQRRTAAAPAVEGDVSRREQDATSLAKPQADSIEESRATLTLDADLLDERARKRAARRNPRLRGRLGFDPSAFSSEPIDSHEFALEVARLQQRQGLRVDGICGPRTCDAAGVAVHRRGNGKSEHQAAPHITGGSMDTAMLERPQSESIDDERATIDLDTVDEDHGPAQVPPHRAAVQRRSVGQVAAGPAGGPTLRALVQQRRLGEATCVVPPLPAVQQRPLARKLDLSASLTVQQERSSASETAAPSVAQVHEAAAVGVAGPSQELPHRPVLEKALGRDLGFVKAHVGGTAAEATAAMGAEAYATGDHAVFAGAPSLHTAAHETAHVLQQRGGGVQLKGGVGEVGDAYERDADQIADAVVRGEAVSMPPMGHAAAAARDVQRQEHRHAKAHGADAVNDPFLSSVDSTRFVVAPTELVLDGTWVSQASVHVIPQAGAAPHRSGVALAWSVVNEAGKPLTSGTVLWAAEAPACPPFAAQIAVAGRHELRIEVVENGVMRKRVTHAVQVRKGAGANVATSRRPDQVRRAAETMTNEQVGEEQAGVRAALAASDNRAGTELAHDTAFRKLRGVRDELAWQEHVRTGGEAHGDDAQNPELDHNKGFDDADPGTIRAHIERVISTSGVKAARNDLRLMAAAAAGDIKSLAPAYLKRLEAEMPLFEAEATQLKQQFEPVAKPIASGMLVRSEERVRAELERYGLKHSPDYVGPEQQAPSADPDHKQLNGLVAAARQVVAAHQRWKEAKVGQARGERSAADVEGLRVALEVTRKTALAAHPTMYMLLHGGQNADTPDVFEAAQMNGPAISGNVSLWLNRKLTDIATCRERLASGDLSVWGIPKVVELAKAQLHIAPGTARDGMTIDPIADQGGGWTTGLLSVFALALGALLAIPTGGSSLAAAGVVTAELALLATDLYLAGKDYDEYRTQRAAANTDMSPAQSPIQEEPSAAALIIALTTAPLGLHGVFDAMRGARQAVHQVRALRRAVASAGGNLADNGVLAAERELLALAEPAVGADQAQQLIRTIERTGDEGVEGTRLSRLEHAAGDEEARLQGAHGDSTVGARNLGDPYQDPRIDPKLPRRYLERRELAPSRKLGLHGSWKQAARALDGEETAAVAIGRVLKDPAEGQEILAALARGDASALKRLGIEDYPHGLDTTGREWALVQTRDGFVVYAGGYGDVELPVDVRVLGHTHPGTTAVGKVGPKTRIAQDLPVPPGTEGMTYEELINDWSVAKNSGLAPSGPDVHAITDGAPHVLHTRYMHRGDGRIGNPIDGQGGSQVAIHLSGAHVVRWHPRSKDFWYEVDVVVKDSTGTQLWSGKMYANWNVPGGYSSIHPNKPPFLAAPPQPGWVDP